MKTPITPEWIRIGDAVVLCGIPKTSLREYFDIYGGPVKTRSLRKPQRKWGLRLVNRESLLDFIESQTAVEEEINVPTTNTGVPTALILTGGDDHE